METKSHNNLEKRSNHERELEKELEKLLYNKENLEKEQKGQFLKLLIYQGDDANYEGYSKVCRKYYIEAINYMKEKEMITEIKKFSSRKSLLEEGKKALDDIIRKYEQKKFYCVAGYHARDSIINNFKFITISPDREKIIEHNIEMFERSIRYMEKEDLFFLAEEITKKAIKFAKIFGLKNKLKEFRKDNKYFRIKKFDITEISDKKIEDPKIIYINAKKHGFKRDSLRYLMDGELRKIEAKIDYERLSSDIGFYGFLYNNGELIETRYLKTYMPDHPHQILHEKRNECLRTLFRICNNHQL